MNKKNKLFNLSMPSKGRLRDASLSFLDSCGIQVRMSGSSREYTGYIKGMPEIQVRFLHANEIPDMLLEGRIHFGITGLDLLREHGGGSHAISVVVDDLKYGNTELVIAVPNSWIDVDSMEDLRDVSVALRRDHRRGLLVGTKFINMTREFFARHGLTDYRIVESLGATEGAPDAGTADIIVDLSSTGTTLAQNHLKTIVDGRILKSRACLAASLEAAWTQEDLEVGKQLIGQIEAHLKSEKVHELRFFCTDGKLKEALPKVMEISQQSFDSLSKRFPSLKRNKKTKGPIVEYSFLCRQSDVYPLVRLLQGAVIGDIIGNKIDYVYDHTSSGFDRLQALLKRKRDEHT